MTAQLIGIGMGPGDPELVTLKALRAIERCEIIAMPKAHVKNSTVQAIAAPYLEGKQILDCEFSMAIDPEDRKKAWRLVADNIETFLQKGQNVAFLTLGDPSTYSTYVYIRELVQADGFTAQTIPGITSYQAAAAAFNVSLCDQDERLHIGPADSKETIEDLIALPGNKILLKTHSKLPVLLESLKARNLGKVTMVTSNVSTPDQVLYQTLEDYEKALSAGIKPGYFTLFFIKPRRNV